MASNLKANSVPVLSVLMAVHNGHPYLRESLDSLLRQTYSDFELIVVDDASTDSSLEILQAEKDPRLRIISLKRNLGLADALNLALEHAKGALVARMDADDIASPGRFLAQVERMNSEPGLVLLGTAFNYIDVDGRVLKTQKVSSEDQRLRQQLFNNCNQFCHPSVMIRKEELLMLGGYRTLAGRLAQDYDLWLRLADVGAIANLSETYLDYRVHKKQVSIKRLFPQRRAAEIYKAMARQRRDMGYEDFSLACKEVDADQCSLRNAVAFDCLHWSELFSHMGDRGRSLFILAKALWAAPHNPAVKQAIKNKLIGRI